MDIRWSVHVFVYKFLVVCTLVLMTAREARAHGRLWEPPSRSSMWRRGYNTSVNINDNELSCGGFMNQWIAFDGHCGVCGDPYQQNPRDNENGGRFASGLITRTYPIGGTIEVTIEITANHGGYFEFKLCPLNDSSVPETHECMDRHKILIVEKGRRAYRHQIVDPSLDGYVNLTLALPPNFRCNHCVLQWRYRTGSRWGCDAQRCGKGVGPQEEFYGCSDIAVGDVMETVYNNPDVTDFTLLPFVQETTESSNTFRGEIHGAVAKSLADKSKSPFTMSHTVRTISEFAPADNYANAGYAIGTGGRIFPFVKNSDFFPDYLPPHEVSRYLEDIVIHAIEGYHGVSKSNDNIIDAAVTCTATSDYHTNPIIHEWCKRTCPNRKYPCPPEMCICGMAFPLEQTLKPPIIPSATLRSGEQREQLDKLIGNKKAFTEFVRRLIRKSKEANTLEMAKHSVSTGHSNSANGHNGVRIGQQLPHVEPRAFEADGVVKIQLFNNKRDKAVDENGGMPMASNRTPLFATKLGTSAQSLGNLIHDLKPKHSDKSQTAIATPYAKTMLCTASTTFNHNKDMKDWCMKNCAFGFCPDSVCTCVYS